MPDNTNSYSKIGAEAARDLGMARATERKDGLLALAQHEAESLAANGPITSDNVMRRLEELGHSPSQLKGNWKGSIFRKSGWVCVGRGPSTKVSSHSRDVRLWARTTWLDHNPMNGTLIGRSAFKLSAIYSEWAKFKSKEELDFVAAGKADDKYEWIIGEQALDSGLRALIKANSGGRFLGIRVRYVTGVGAVLTSLAIPAANSAEADREAMRKLSRPDLNGDVPRGDDMSDM